MRYSSQEIISPKNPTDLMNIIREAAKAGKRVKALGSAHSFNDIADTDGIQVSLREHF